MLEAGQERVTRQSIWIAALVLLCEAGLQCGDHAGLARPRRSLYERDVRRVQGNIERKPLPVIGVREHIPHRFRDRLQAATMPLWD